MSYFSGPNNLSLLVKMLCFLFLYTGISPVVGDENPFLGPFSREEMVQMAGYGEERLSTVLVTGSVNYEACSHGEADHLQAWPVSGAKVAVNCMTGGGKRTRVAQGVTDEFGDFMIDLPSHLHAIPNLEKICSVKVLGIPKKLLCHPTYARRNKGTLTLSSVGNGIRTYSAGSIRFQHRTLSKSYV